MQSKINIMQITSNLGIGGLERVISNICKHIDKRHFTVSVCCLHFKGAFAEELENEGISVHLVPGKDTGPDYFAFYKLNSIMKKASRLREANS